MIIWIYLDEHYIHYVSLSHAVKIHSRFKAGPFLQLSTHARPDTVLYAMQHLWELGLKFASIPT